MGIGVASFFSDLGHESATAILPMFLVSIGASPAALGTIEGVADAVSSFTKLAAGFYSDRLRKKKSVAASGYLLTGISTASFAVATNWVHLLIGRGVGWLGRGIRGPVRDVILSESIPAGDVGKAFGFDRALDTAGAVAGPILALWLVGFASYRQIFLFSIIPGILAAISFAWIIREPPVSTVEPRSFRMSLKELPPEFRRFLLAVGVFGVGDFAHTLLILRASQILSQSDPSGGSHTAVMLYVVHNVVYASASYPVGALGDRIGRTTLLAIGYALAGAMCLGFLLPSPSVAIMLILFSAGGFYIAIEDSLERAVAAELLPPTLRGTGFGVLASLNGFGDLISSSTVGLLWSTVSPEAGFLFAAVFSFGGALFMRFGISRRSWPAS